MSIDGSLRPIKQYDVSNDGLKRAVSQLEDNVRKSLGNIATEALPRLQPTALKTSAYVAGLDDLVMASGTFSVQLPVATPANAGLVIGVVVESGAISVSSTNTNVQGSSSADVLSTAGLYLYVSTGVDWWRPPLGSGASITPATTVVSETSFAQAPAVGTAVTYAREDHTHGTPAAPSVPTASGSVVGETTFGLAASAGAVATYSRGDHTHGSPPTPVTSIATDGTGISVDASTGAVTLSAEDLVSSLLEALQDETRLLLAIDAKLAVVTHEFPFEEDTL